MPSDDLDWSVWEEAQSKAVDVVEDNFRGRLWLTDKGTFVRPGGRASFHGSVIPKGMATSVGPDYKAFAHATKAIRLLVSPMESTIHLWEPPNSEQVKAMSQLMRQTVLIQGDRDNGSTFAIQFLNYSAEDKFRTGLRKVTRFIEGDEGIVPGSELIEFKNQEIKETREVNLGERFVLPTFNYRPSLPEYGDE